MRRPTAIAAVAAALVAAAVVAWTVDGAPSDPAAAEAADDAGPAAPTPAQQRDTATARPGTVPAQQVSGVAEADTLTPAERAIIAHRRADRGPEQPVPFSHRFHVSELQVGCEYCHTGTRESPVATMPSLSVCMGCHRTVGRDLPAIGKLQSAWDAGEPIAWNRVYKVPEFVQFKHQPHLRNDVQCQECHGPVEEMDRVYKASSLSMGWCLSCHRQQPADSDVATDHELVEQAHLPDAPEGRQPVGMYPRTIATGYGEDRAPDDCATCHY